MQEAKLFQNGRAVRLPKEFRFEGESVGVKRVGKAVVLVPLTWDALWDSLSLFSADFMDEWSQPGAERRLAVS